MALFSSRTAPALEIRASRSSPHPYTGSVYEPKDFRCQQNSRDHPNQDSRQMGKRERPWVPTPSLSLLAFSPSADRPAFPVIMVHRRPLLAPTQRQDDFVTDPHVLRVYVRHLDVEPPALAQIYDTHDRGRVRRDVEVVAREGENLAGVLQRHFLQRVVILAGDTHPGDRVLAGAAAQAVRPVEAHILFLFLG